MTCVLLLLSVLSAPDSRDLRALFTHRAAVITHDPGPALLEVPLPVLAQARPDLANLRLLDDAGHEVPYAQVPPMVAKPRAMESHVAEVRNVTQSVGSSQPPIYLREYTVVLPGVLLQQGPWQLSVEVPQGDFVADVKISDADGTALANSSVFRVPGLPAKTTLALPPLSADRDHLLKVTFSSLQGLLAGTFTWTPAMHQILPPAAANLTLTLLESRHTEGRSVYIVEHPPGLSPVALRLVTSTPSFSRRVSIWDSPSGGDSMGAATLYRLKRPQPSAGDLEFMELPLQTSHSPRWRVEVQDDGSEPLQDLHLQVLAEPGVLLMQAGDRPVTLYVGGNRTFLHHDLENLLQAALPDLSTLPHAALGPVENNPAYSHTPALQFAMHAGAQVDPRLYSHMRVVRLPDAPEGVSTLQLGAEDLAVSQQDLKDVRLVDANNQQWPAILARDSTQTWHPTPLETLPLRGKNSIYRVPLPSPRTRIAGIALDSNADWFERSYIMQLKLPNGQIDARPGQLQRRPNRPGEIVIELPIKDVVGVELLIDNGDDAPLTWQGSRTLLVSSTLYVTAPAGAYRLLIGNASDTGAQYELKEVGNLVQTVLPSVASEGPVAINPEHNASLQLANGLNMQQVFMWSVLALAVLVLGGLTLRQVRQMGPAK